MAESPEAASQPLAVAGVPSAHHVVVLAAVFVAGAALMAVELTGARIVAVTFGSTIFVWGSTVGIFMASLSVGYYVGGRWADRAPRVRVLGGLTVLAGLATVPVPLLGYGLSAFVGRTVFPDSPVFSSAVNPILVMVVLFLPCGALMGALSPFAVRILARKVEGLGRVAGKVYGASALGSIAGALVVVFFLMSVLPNRAILFGAAACLVAAGIVALCTPEAGPAPEAEPRSPSAE